MTGTHTPVCYGYQGKGNIGDNLMFLLNTHDFSAVYVKEGRGVRPSDIELSTIRYIWKLLFADAVIFSGGNIFNVDRPRSVLKILAFYLLVSLRRALGTETSFRSIGVNKNTPPFVRRLAIRTILAASDAHLRETSITSTQLWKQMTLAQKKVTFAPDVVFTGDLDKVARVSGFRDMAKQYEGQSFAVYFPSIVARREAEQKTHVEQDAITLPEEVSTIYVVVQAPDDASIQPKFLEGKDIVLVQSGVDTMARILALVLSARVIVTERYHGAILAKRFGVPMITSNFSEKLRDIEMVA